MYKTYKVVCTLLVNSSFKNSVNVKTPNQQSSFYDTFYARRINLDQGSKK